MNKYGLQNKFHAIEDKKEALIAILIKASKIVLALPQCHLYMLSTEKENPNCIWVTEVWDSQDDHDKALMDPHVLNLIKEALPLLSAMPEKGSVLTIIDGE